MSRTTKRFIPTHVGNTSPNRGTTRCRTVHPHARGEHVAHQARMGGDCGSSPRTWGTLQHKRSAHIESRFIPTHVGNTCSPVGSVRAASVHPHARGEHWQLQMWSATFTGSSPRTWGTQAGGLAGLAHFRFIPTHVGNTDVPAAGSPNTSVHPHARGEHGFVGDLHAVAVGSSPRTWGTHLPYRIVFKEEKTPRKIYRLILYSVVRSRGWNATNCSPSNNTGCRRLTPRVWNS